MVLAAVAAFATIASFVLPLLTGDRLDSRMKYVATERDRLRAERMAQLADEQRASRLQERAAKLHEARRASSSICARRWRPTPRASG